MSTLPFAIHTAAQVRALDRHAIDDLGIPSYALMTRAGEAAFASLRDHWPDARRILVVCGPGNNAGDGYVLARLARAQGLAVFVAAVSEPARLHGDARRAHDDFLAAGGVTQAWSVECVRQADVIVDALFGTGLSRALDATLAGVIQGINDSAIPVLSLDVPSGLHADTGQVLGAAVVAQRTLTFIGLKLGFYLGEGQDHTGIVAFDALGLPQAARAVVDIVARRIDPGLPARLLPPRRRLAHKRQHGSVLVIGGGPGMAGAARMAGEAALRAGAGLVTIATRPENVAAIIPGRPELMCRGVQRGEDLQALIERADVLAVGPGLGEDDWAQALFETALASDRTLVIDADGLNLLAQRPSPEPTQVPGQHHQAAAQSQAATRSQAFPGKRRWILTPHPGEAAHLLGWTSAQVQADRLGAARGIASRYGATVVLKGAGTLVVREGEVPWICDRGNPGMASAGMGDVLTGIIAGIAAQLRDRLIDRLPGRPAAGEESAAPRPAGPQDAQQAALAEAACAAVSVHAMAGDLAAGRGERGLLATDLFVYLPTCVNPSQRS